MQMQLNSQQAKYLRGLAHALKPSVCRAYPTAAQTALPDPAGVRILVDSLCIKVAQ